jgi:hypothetical protein
MAKVPSEYKWECGDAVCGENSANHGIFQSLDMVIYPAKKKGKNGIKINIDQQKKSAEIN